MRNKVLVLCFVASHTLSTVGCKRPSQPEPVLATVRLGKVMRVSEDSGVAYSVALQPFRQVDLSFKSAGLVDWIRTVRGSDGRSREVTFGDSAPAGALLGHVRLIDYQDKIDTARGALNETIAALDAAKASQVLARLNYDRSLNLYNDKSLTKQNFDQATQTRDSSNAAVREAEGNVLNAKGNLEQAELALHDADIKSPFDSVIVSRQAELGNVVASGVAAFTVADIRALKADFTIRDVDLGQVKLGRRVDLLLPGFQSPIAAVVTSVSATADSNSRVFTAEATLNNTQRLYKPGAIGRLTLQGQPEQRSVLTVPLQAILRDPSSGAFSVFVRSGSGETCHVILRTVQIGNTIGSDVEVRSGLSKGEQVVVVGAQDLHNGDTVRVQE